MPRVSYSFCTDAFLSHSAFRYPSNAVKRTFSDAVNRVLNPLCKSIAGFTFIVFFPPESTVDDSEALDHSC